MPARPRASAGRRRSRAAPHDRRTRRAPARRAARSRPEAPPLRGARDAGRADAATLGRRRCRAARTGAAGPWGLRVARRIPCPARPFSADGSSGRVLRRALLTSPAHPYNRAVVPKVAQAGEFFVVGGPVQPDRACYVERAADAELLRGIGEQRFCYVLAARSTGKSSLMARAIRALRRDGQLAAVVDLSQIAAHSEAGAAARWCYAIAYRVLRELRLKFDLQGWWQEKSALAGEQRLAEFFSDVVLTHTSVPVTVFIDEIERTLALPFAQELYATIHSCYARRVSDPDYARLNFVVLGVASPAALCPDPTLSPFVDGLAIEPADFTLEQSLTLAPGFGDDLSVGRTILERIHVWAGGQPYLTQRIARGVARKGGRAEDVERVVREQFLAAGAAEKDPYLNGIRLVLIRRG